MNNQDPLLHVKNLKVYFDGDSGPVRSVDDISFHVDRGETLAIVGESGSGKSVTSLSIMRLVSSAGRIAGGEIVFNGQNLLMLSEPEMRRIRGNDISMIFQEPMTSLNPVHTIGNQVVEAIVQHQNKTYAQAKKMAVEMLEMVEVPEPQKRINYYPHQMSGGQRQRVMIAMALSCKPSLIIADEPTTALDVIIQAQILNLMKKLRQELGASILFITHDLGVAAEIADRVIVMQKGRIVEKGTVHDVFKNPQHPYTQRLLAAVPRIDLQKPAPVARCRSPVLIEVRHLRKWFPVTKGIFERTVSHIKAVNDLTLDLHRGEILGLVGESGSGKTTAGRAVLRLIEPTSGSIVFDGTNVLQLGADQLRHFRRRMQIIFQDPYGSLNPRMTITDILSEPLSIHGLYKSRAERRQRVRQLLELVQLEPECARRYPHEFSGGQRQRVGIARALAVEPDFIIADECVSALDVSIRREVLNLIKDLQKRLGLTMLFISHDLAVVENIADRVAVMFRGDLVEISSAHNIYRAPQDDYTKALLSAVPMPDPDIVRTPVAWDAQAYSSRRASIARQMSESM